MAYWTLSYEGDEWVGRCYNDAGNVTGVFASTTLSLVNNSISNLCCGSVQLPTIDSVTNLQSKYTYQKRNPSIIKTEGLRIVNTNIPDSDEITTLNKLGMNEFKMMQADNSNNSWVLFYGKKI